MSDTHRPVLPTWYTHWRRRHQHPVSFALHLLGIPLTIASIPLAIVQLTRDQWDLWWRPVALLVGGYLLQWIGHLIEGNDMGEVILIKKRLGKPTIAVSPKYAKPPNISQPDDMDTDSNG